MIFTESLVATQLQHQSKHCGICGNTHSGNCKPDSFAYFQCSDCKGGQMMPFDACFGFEHIHCCSDKKSAADTWVSITYEQYKQLEVQL